MSRYIIVETAISMAVNSALSALFAFLIFSRLPVISGHGLRGYGFDFLPQSFMIGLMSVVIPTLLTRSRIRSRKLAMQAQTLIRMPRRLLFRAPLLALGATVLGGGIAMLISQAIGPDFDFASVLRLKIIYGACLAAVITPVGLRYAMAGD